MFDKPTNFHIYKRAVSLDQSFYTECTFIPPKKFLDFTSHIDKFIYTTRKSL